MSRSPGSSEGYVLLCNALKNERPEAAKSLLRSGCKVKRQTKKFCNTALHFAAMHGYIEIVEMMLDQGAHIGDKNEFGKTPLHVAIDKEKMKVAELLLKRGARANATDNYGTSILDAASSNEKCSQIVKLLLQCGAHLPQFDTFLGWKTSYTHLHFAVGKGEKKHVTLLLSKGFDVDAKMNDDVTPLHMAAEKGYTCIAKELLNYGACIHSVTSEKGYTPLHFAIKNKQRTVVKLLLQHGAKVDNKDKSGKTILYLAVETGCSTIVGDVLKYCPDIYNQSNRKSLIIAVYSYGKQYENIVEALLEYGFDFNPEDAENSKLLHAAVGQGYLKIVEDLLKYGANVNMLHDSTFKGFTPLHTAAKCKQEQVAKLLISYESDINAQDKTGKTPIFYAIENADLKITKLLLTNRANVKDSPELLHIAGKKKCIEIVQALLQHDVNINASDEYGRTALHFAVSNESRCYSRNSKYDAEDPDDTICVKIVELLLSKGANVNAKQKDGLTALHIAIEKRDENVVNVLLKCGAQVDSKSKNDIKNGYQEIIETILKFGADINCRDNYGKTPLHIASYKGHLEVVENLLEYGSDINITSRNDRTPLDSAMAGGESFIRAVDNYDYNKDFRDDYNYDYEESYYGYEKYYYGYDDDNNDNNFDSERGVTVYEEIAEALERHMIKLKTANLYVSEKNLRSVGRIEVDYFQYECKKEIADMKSEKINNANISFYDILAIRPSSLKMYMRDENILQVLKSDDYKTKFPIYAFMIENHFRKSMIRNELLEQANEICHFLFNNVLALPYDCTEKIFSYLSNEDLRILIDACKPLSICNPNTNE